MENQPAPPTVQKKSASDPLVGSVLDSRFDIESIIGRGSTSTVYKAKELATGETIAIKMLHANLAFDDGLVARFEREAQAAKILNHHNVAAVKEWAATEKGNPYLVEEFVEGESLQQTLNLSGPLNTKQATEIFLQICAGLAAAHDCGIVHRDLKPANIMVKKLPSSDIEQRVEVKILDFGCAKLTVELGETVLRKTQTGEMLGSLLYMSPEQCLDGEIDGRSDIYSLGCMLYEALTCKAPLTARTAFETMNKQLATMPESLHHTRPDLQFSKGLEAIIFRAMAKAPDKRYQTTAKMMDDLLFVAQDKLPSATVSPEINGAALVKPDTVAMIESSAQSKAKALSNAKTVLLTTVIYFPFAWLFVMYSGGLSIGLLPGLLFSFGLLLVVFNFFAEVGADSRAVKSSALKRPHEKRELPLWDINHEVFVQLGYSKAFDSNSIFVFGASQRSGGKFRVKADWPNRPPIFLTVMPVRQDNSFWGALSEGNSNAITEDTRVAIAGATLDLDGASYLYVNSRLASIVKTEE